MHRNGSSNPYDYKTFNETMNKQRKVVKVIKPHFPTVNWHNISFAELEAREIEPYRIANPDEVASLVDPVSGDHITHYTWNAQMEYMPDVKTYTEIGALLAKEAKAEESLNGK